MESGPIAADTPLEIERLQQKLWSEMSRGTKARLVTGLCRAVQQAGLAGIRLRHPSAGPREQFLRFALLVLGRDLAVEAFPDAAHLSD